MNLHNRIIQELVNNHLLLEVHVEMYDCEISTEVSLGDKGDIDILLYGIDYMSQNQLWL